MASISGGDLIEATYNHPSLGTGTFNFMGSEDGTFMLGGFSTADDTAKIDGAGNAIWTMNQKQWTVEGVISWDMNSGGDQLEIWLVILDNLLLVLKSLVVVNYQRFHNNK